MKYKFIFVENLLSGFSEIKRQDFAALKVK